MQPKCSQSKPMSFKQIKRSNKWTRVRRRFIKKESIKTKGNLHCNYCLTQVYLTHSDSNKVISIDHFVPISKGGDCYSEKNLRISCVPCNGSKTDLLFADWINYLGEDGFNRLKDKKIDLKLTTGNNLWTSLKVLGSFSEIFKNHFIRHSSSTKTLLVSESIARSSLFFNNQNEIILSLSQSLDEVTKQHAIRVVKNIIAGNINPKEELRFSLFIKGKMAYLKSNKKIGGFYLSIIVKNKTVTIGRSQELGAVYNESQIKLTKKIKKAIYIFINKITSWGLVPYDSAATN
jgi:hypothetical protein